MINQLWAGFYYRVRRLRSSSKLHTQMGEPTDSTGGGWEIVLLVEGGNSQRKGQPEYSESRGGEPAVEGGRPYSRCDDQPRGVAVVEVAGRLLASLIAASGCARGREGLRYKPPTGWNGRGVLHTARGGAAGDLAMLESRRSNAGSQWQWCSRPFGG